MQFNDLLVLTFRTRGRVGPTGVRPTTLWIFNRGPANYFVIFQPGSAQLLSNFVIFSCQKTILWYLCYFCHADLKKLLSKTVLKQIKSTLKLPQIVPKLFESVQVPPSPKISSKIKPKYGRTQVPQAFGFKLNSFFFKSNSYNYLANTRGLHEENFWSSVLNWSPLIAEEGTNAKTHKDYFFPLKKILLFSRFHN